MADGTQVSDGLRIGICSTVGALHSLASIVTVTINGLLLFVIFRDPLKCFRKPFGVLITGLAATDFLFGAIVDTVYAKNQFYCVKNEHRETNFDYVMDYFIDNSTTVLVLALSVDRLLAVAFPIFYRYSVKKTQSAIAVVMVWIYSLVFSLIQLTEISEDVYDTIDVHLHVTFVLTATGIIYCIIYFIIRKRRKSFPGSEESASSKKREQHLTNLQREREFAFTAFLILVVLVLTQIPYLVITTIGANCKSCQDTSWYFVCHKFSDFLLCGSAIGNPFLYGWRVKQFRSSFKAVFCRSRVDQVEIKISQTMANTTFPGNQASLSSQSAT